MKPLPLWKKDRARRIIRNFRRYRIDSRTDKSTWDQAGPYTPNGLIPACTRREAAEADRIMRRAGYQWFGTRIVSVDPSTLKTFQKCLRFSSLLWNLKHFERMQERFRVPARATKEQVDAVAHKLPKVVVLGDGTRVVWNGNHRTTDALLLGLDRILVQVFTAGKKRAGPDRKKRTKERS